MASWGQTGVCRSPKGQAASPMLSLPRGAPTHTRSRAMPAFLLQVNETTLKVAASANPVYPSDQTTEEKQSTDSGAYSIGH